MTHYPHIHLQKSTLKYDWFELVDDCKVITLIDCEIIIPQGYTTDFASVWQGLWWLLPPHGRMANAAIVHDYWYECRLFADELGNDWARDLADLDFLYRCLEAGVPKWQAFLVFHFLRLFAKKYWYKTILNRDKI